jgi:acyl-CoA hydrolase
MGIGGVPDAVLANLGNHKDLGGACVGVASPQHWCGVTRHSTSSILRFHPIPTDSFAVATEMFSDGVLPLVQAGVITGAKKASEIGQISASFALGSQALYDFIDNNPGVTMLDCAYTNDTEVIRRQPKMTAINSAIEVSRRWLRATACGGH